MARNGDSVGDNGGCGSSGSNGRRYRQARGKRLVGGCDGGKAVAAARMVAVRANEDPEEASSWQDKGWLNRLGRLSQVMLAQTIDGPTYLDERAASNFGEEGDREATAAASATPGGDGGRAGSCTREVDNGGGKGGGEEETKPALEAVMTLAIVTFLFFFIITFTFQPSS